ncbi:uncharacterized protein LOC132184223 [Corylus avellana]|uniref:uncharacterized protein LOC132184223 n=1 Tax=Corylus avellana TaxID=13451 RepID=UPI002869FD69|nr:uncharacterized protein LOC132184223 [Corylus avellana]
MAGRPKSKRRGNTRMDAAVDAMRSYGFSEELVKEMVRELLNVYGGDDGWVFIEEFSYTLLLDYILAKQEGDSSAASAIGPPSGVRLPLCTNSEAVDAECEQAANSGGGGGGTPENILFQRPPHMSQSPLPVDNLPTRRRKPYHGWIGNDGADDLVHLTPAPLRESLEKLLTPAALQESYDKLLNGMSSRRKRKSGWDARPQDM